MATYCPHCASQINPKASLCPTCKKSIPSPYGPKTNTTKEKGLFGWALLALLDPIKGFILSLIWQEQKPERARYVLIGATIGLMLCFLIPSLIVIGKFL